MPLPNDRGRRGVACTRARSRSAEGNRQRLRPGAVVRNGRLTADLDRHRVAGRQNADQTRYEGKQSLTAQRRHLLV